MGLFNIFSKNATKPYKDEGLNKIYELLFCDNINLFKTEKKSLLYPWDILLSDNPNKEKLRAIATDKSLEGRHRMLAYNLLGINGETTNEKELLGVIVEVALPEGLDVLAAFSDGSARYINHSEKILVWETQTEQSNELIKELFSDSKIVVNQIGPWDKERKPFPTRGMVRMTFLVSNGLYFGEGSFDALQREPMAGDVINSAMQLMTYLTKQAL